MQFKYYHHIQNEHVLEGIKKLLRLCDREFVPPLSMRESTTQAKLCAVSQKPDGVLAYFAEIAKQSAIVVLDGRNVVAFMSFRKDYVCEHISNDYLPNLYVTTVIVSPEYRNRNIAGKMYEELIRRFPKRYLFTRTWSTNLSHIRILLLSQKFHEHCVLSNDRGENIDTIYYRREPQKQHLAQYIQQYRLTGNIFFAALLFVITAAFVLWWLFADTDMVRELTLAIATSLMASLLCLVSDTFLKLREAKSDRYINSLKSYGIANLQFNKNELLESIIPHCRKEIWISGYRLVMTGKAAFRQALVTACKRSRGLSIKLLVTPPWTEAYRLVYGQEDVTQNYLRVLKDLAECREKYGIDLQVAFSEKPLFNDTYKVDDRFVTGPYLHCSDKYNNRITAKDFFSFDITAADSKLYRIFSDDYLTLWAEAYAKLDVDRFYDTVKDIPDISALDQPTRTQLLRDCCVSVDD